MSTGKKRVSVDNDDDESDEFERFDDVSEHSLSHSDNEGDNTRLPMIPLKSNSGFLRDGVLEIPDLQKRREEQGMLPDDGGPSRYDKKGDANRNAVPYNLAWLTEEVARERMLYQNPYYRFIVQVSGGSNEARPFLREPEISAEARRRVTSAQAAVLQRRREQQDTSTQQTRAAALRTEIERLRGLLNNVEATQIESRSASARAAASLVDFNTAAKAAQIGVSQEKSYADLFDIFTRTGVAKFGPRGYARTPELLTAVVETALGDYLSAQLAFPLLKDNAQKLLDLMPQTVALTLNWALVFATLENASLQAAVLPLLQFPAGSTYVGTPALYMQHVETLARMVFVNGSAGKFPVSNLLLFDQITLFFYSHINTMLLAFGGAKSAVDAELAPLPRPKTPVDKYRQATQFKVNDIVVTVEMSDEDLQAAVRGDDVRRVTAVQLQTAQKQLRDNNDAPRTIRVLLRLLEPLRQAMLRSPSFFYLNASALDDGADEEAFAGGYYEGRVARPYEYMRGKVPTGGDALSSTFLVSTAILRGALTGFWPVLHVDDATINALLNEPALGTRLLETMLRVLGLTDVQSSRYRTNVLDRYIRTTGLLFYCAQFALAQRKLGLLVPMSEQQYAKFQLYVDAFGKTAGLRLGATSDAAFVTAENDAYDVFTRVDTLTDEPVARLFSILPERLVNLLSFAQKAFVARAIAALDAARPVVGLAGRKVTLEHDRPALEAQIKNLTTQVDAIDRDIKKWQDLSVDQEMRLIYSILSGPVFTSENSLRPINTGLYIAGDLMLAAINTAYTKLKDYVPCVPLHYTEDQLALSDLYWVQFAALTTALMRRADVRMPKLYRNVAAEPRSSVQTGSELEFVRNEARRDACIGHNCDFECPIARQQTSGGGKRFRIELPSRSAQLVYARQSGAF